MMMTRIRAALVAVFNSLAGIRKHGAYGTHVASNRTTAQDKRKAKKRRSKRRR